MKKTMLFTLIAVLIVSVLVYIVITNLGRPELNDSLRKVDRPDLFSVAGASFIPITPDPLYAGISILDIDSYGRVLFVYHSSDSPIRDFAFICQKSDAEYAYFYDDICFCEALTGKTSKNDFADLQKSNDWGEPIVEDRCSKVILNKENLRYDDINHEIIKKHFVNSEAVQSAFAVCKDKNGLMLYGYYESSDGKITRMCAAIVKNDEIIAEKELDRSDFIYDVSQFKADCGWDSSECEIILRKSNAGRHFVNGAGF